MLRIGVEGLALVLTSTVMGESNDVHSPSTCIQPSSLLCSIDMWRRK